MNTKAGGDKVIFIVIDDVLSDPYEYDLVYDIFGFFGLKDCLLRRFSINDWMIRHFNMYGVRTYRVFLLWTIAKIAKADIVLYSSWRYDMRNPYNKTDRYIELKRKLEQLGLSIHLTKRLFIRNEEIQSYLNEHPNIKNYVIIDDCIIYLDRFTRGDHLVITSCNKKTQGCLYGNTGLKLEDAIKAIKILNNKEGMQYNV